MFFTDFFTIFILINMRKMEIIKELSVFNNIKYYDEPHKYYIDGVKQATWNSIH